MPDVNAGKNPGSQAPGMNKQRKDSFSTSQHMTPLYASEMQVRPLEHVVNQ